MKKILITILMVALLIGTAQAANRFGDTYHAVQVKDETGRNVTDITNLYIYLPGTTTDAVIYADKNRQNTIFIPMTEASSNTTLIDGLFTWWGPDKYDFSMTNTDGVGPMTNSGHADRDSSGGLLVFPTYLVSITSASFTDSESISMGTGASWVINSTSDVLGFTPAGDDQTVNFGTSGTGLNTNFNVYTGVSLGFKLSSSGATHSFTYDGGIVNLNPSSNFAVNICGGSSTGATTIGNSAGGAFAVDTGSSITLNADDSFAVTVSAGTIGIAATGNDITIDATDKSLILRGSEEVGNAVVIDADGTAGGVTIDSGTGDITLTSTDDIILVTTGKVTITNTEAMTISGALDIAGTITMASDEVISNAVDDTISVTSNDEAMTFQVLGHANAKSAILELSADAAADNDDTWTHTVADGGAYTIANEGTATMTISEAVTITGAFTMSGGQTRKETLDGLGAVVPDGANPPGTIGALGTNAQSLVWAWQFDGNGSNGDDFVFLRWNVPDGYVTDSLRLNVGWSYSNAETNDDDVVFDMTVQVVAQGTAAAAGDTIDAGGTAFTQGDTNLDAGNGDEGKLIVTQLNPEVLTIAVDDTVIIMFWVDESESDLDASGTCDVHFFEMEWESTE